MNEQIQQIRRRLVDGEGGPEDYSWAARRLEALATWPEELSWDQKAEVQNLERLLAEQEVVA